jgi:competence ComEA-like helix-hairpin-helix protein
MGVLYRLLPAFGMLLVLAAVAWPGTARAFGVQEAVKPPEPSQLPEKRTIEPIDINRASAEEFAKLPGIGPELARRIVAFREKHGPFRRVEDLLAIRGVGHKKWKSIRPSLRVGNEAEKKKTMNDE